MHEASINGRIDVVQKVLSVSCVRCFWSGTWIGLRKDEIAKNSRFHFIFRKSCSQWIRRMIFFIFVYGKMVIAELVFRHDDFWWVYFMVFALSSDYRFYQMHDYVGPGWKGELMRIFECEMKKCFFEDIACRQYLVNMPTVVFNRFLFTSSLFERRMIDFTPKSNACNSIISAFFWLGVVILGSSFICIRRLCFPFFPFH